jgi:hypothetical protein
MGIRFLLRAMCALLLAVSQSDAQIIEFESNGLKYQTLTRDGVTLMFAPIPHHVRGYTVLQVAIQNGSSLTWTVKPEEFTIYETGGAVTPATPAREVVNEMISKAGRGDVIKLVTAYESTLYGNNRYKATNGYEARRQNALVALGSNKVQAGAAASAIVMVPTKLKSGESTDGAVFFPTSNKASIAGKLIVRTAGAVFEFPMLSSN